MQGSQNRVTYQASTTWCFGKSIQKKRIPGSQPQRSSTLESSSARSTRTTLTSRRRLLLQSTPHHQWLGQQSSPPSLPSGNEDDQRKDDQRKDVLRSASSEETRKASESVWFSRARSRRVAGDLSPWRSVGEPAFGGLVICSSTPNWTAPYSNQVSSLITNLCFSFLVFSSGWKVFSSTIPILMIFRFSSSVSSSSGWDVFYRLIPCPSFLPQSPITGLRGFFTSDMILLDTSASLLG